MVFMEMTLATIRRILYQLIQNLPRGGSDFSYFHLGDLDVASHEYMYKTVTVILHCVYLYYDYVLLETTACRSRDCKFPFTYAGQTFNKCANLGSGYDWCFTESNSGPDAKWAKCDSRPGKRKY